MGFLDGIKVIDFTHAYAGPFCTQILGDFGAEVIKVEKINEGDQARGWAPFKNDYSGYYASFNRAKKSITVDISSEKGQEILKKLILEADIVCSNFKAGTLERYGLGFEDIKKERPDIIYSSISGFGSKGEFSKFAAYDNVIQAVSGVMDVNGFPDRAPSKIGPAIGDSYSGLLLLLGIMIALYHKKMTGEGQEVTVSMLGALFGLLEYPVLEYTVGKNLMSRIGNTGLYYYPDDTYLAGDGEYVAVTIRNDNEWGKFCSIYGIDLEEKLKTNDQRLKEKEYIREIVERAIAELSAEEVERMSDGSNLAIAEVIDISKALKSEQLKEREMIIDVKDPVIGDLKLVGNPIKLSENEQRLNVPSPTVGQHTDEILLDLGLTDSEIADLRKTGII